MSEIVDARGLSCPQPVLLTLSKLKQVDAGEIEVQVDNEVSRENVTRAARNQGWEIADIVAEKNEYRIVLRRG
jgi:TusA-related sulfurtransferase